MRDEDIPAFVEAVIETGCNICAVGQLGYVLGDVDLPPHRQEEIAPRPREISETFGERDHLMPKIIAHLRSIGRCIEI
jgi:hypothetical protein